MSKFRQFAVYGILFFPLASYWFYRILKPTYWSEADPAAWYFLDSLAIFIGKTYVFVDHPGIPVQIIGSLLLAITYPFFGNIETFITFYTRNPAAFYFLTRIFQLFVNGSVILLFYKTAVADLRENKTLSGLALAWMFLAIHPYSLRAINIWSHEAFSIFGTLWLLLLYRELHDGKSFDRKKQFLFGFAAGILVTIQILFVTWIVSGIIIGLLFSLKTKKRVRQAILDAFYFAIGSALAIGIVLSVISKELPKMMNWFVSLATHSGQYGTGEENLFSANLIFESLRFWGINLPAMAITFLLGILIIGASFFSARKRDIKIAPVDFSFTLGLLIHVVIQLIFLSKDYASTRYAISVAAIIPVFMLSAISLLEQISIKTAWIQKSLYAFTLICTMIVFIQQIQFHQEKFEREVNISTAKSVVTNTISQRLKIPKNEVVTLYFGLTEYATIPVKCAGLLAANYWINAFDEEIAAACPDQYVLNNLDELADRDWDLLIIHNMHGSPENIEKLTRLGAIHIPEAWGIKNANWFFIPADQ